MFPRIASISRKDFNLSRQPCRLGEIAFWLGVILNFYSSKILFYSSSLCVRDWSGILL